MAYLTCQNTRKCNENKGLAISVKVIIEHPLACSCSENIENKDVIGQCGHDGIDKSEIIKSVSTLGGSNYYQATKERTNEVNCWIFNP